MWLAFWSQWKDKIIAATVVITIFRLALFYQELSADKKDLVNHLIKIIFLVILFVIALMLFIGILMWLGEIGNKIILVIKQKVKEKPYKTALLIGAIAIFYFLISSNLPISLKVASNSDGYYGYKNIFGSWVISPIYSNAEGFVGDTAMVYEHKNYEQKVTNSNKIPEMDENDPRLYGYDEPHCINKFGDEVNLNNCGHYQS